MSKFVIMRNLFLGVVALIVGIKCSCVNTQAASVIETGKCGENITYTIDSDGLLTLSGSGMTWNYGYNSYLFKENNNIREVIIEDGVTSIGTALFYGCPELQSVTIPESVTVIKNDAFGYCRKLKTIIIPKSVKRIGGAAFAGCEKLEMIALPDGLTEIQRNMFIYCINLESITIPKSVVRIEDAVFVGCTCFRKVYYTGTEEEWEEVSVSTYDNKILEDATLIYNSSELLMSSTIKLSTRNKTIKKKKSYTLVVSNLANGDKIISVKSNKPSVAKVKKISEGKYKITGIKKGTAKVTVKLKSGRKDTCRITVK